VARERVVRSALIAIDWGTTTARAYWLDPAGRSLAQTSAPLGVQQVGAGGFPAALRTLLGDAAADAPVIACGMIGSRQGWIEAAYCACPADLATIAAALTPVPGTRVAIVPGLLCHDADGVPDVLRGEETQILGTLEGAPVAPRLIVLPGTHSKWARCGAGGIEAFATFMTGELYALLRTHSMLGRLATDGNAFDSAAFARGVRTSLRAGAALSHDLFSARSLALTGALAPEGVADYLSGLLLGAEVAAARDWARRDGVEGETVTLVGDAALCERYRQALALAGFAVASGPPDAAARGMWRIARQAGMLAA
jgi:2-dehydro-3-deoxygalactonokinase